MATMAAMIAICLSEFGSLARFSFRTPRGSGCPREFIWFEYIAIRKLRETTGTALSTKELAVVDGQGANTSLTKTLNGDGIDIAQASFLQTAYHPNRPYHLYRKALLAEQISYGARRIRRIPTATVRTQLRRTVSILCPSRAVFSVASNGSHRKGDHS